MSRNQFQGTAAERLEWARRVKAFRQQAGMTQQELADLAEVSRQTIVNMESGSFTPQTGVLRRVLEVLRVDLEEREFSEETELWLSMMGALIEAIPHENRSASVNNAVRALSEGIRAGKMPRADVGGATQHEDLHAVDLREEHDLAATHDDSVIDPSRGEA